MGIASVLAHSQRRLVSRLVMGSVVTAGIVLIAACNRPASAPALSSPDPLRVTPDAIQRQLSPTESVEAAASQLASLVGAPAGVVRVRIQPRDCQICSAAEAQATIAPEGVPLAEVAAQLGSDPGSIDIVWLVVQELACMYYFDGATWLPKNCQFSPL